MEHNEVNIETIYHEVKQKWLQEEAPRKPLRHHIADSVPYWIIIVALVFFALSAQHTIAIFNGIAPGAGYAAPIGIEFGLLFASTARQLSKSHKGRMTWQLGVLEVLLFLVAMLVNGAGSVVSAVESRGLETLSAAAIIEQFGTMPVTTQALLIVAVAASLFIPLGATVAGQEVARLMLERERGTDDFAESKWREVEREFLYRSVYTKFYGVTGDAKRAKREAKSAVSGFLAARSSRSSAPSGTVFLPSGVSKSEIGQSGPQKIAVTEYFKQNPDVLDMSVREATKQINADGVKASKSLVHTVMQEIQSVDAE